MTLTEINDSIETLLVAVPMTKAEHVYWVGWLRCLTTLGELQQTIEQEWPGEMRKLVPEGTYDQAWDKFEKESARLEDLTCKVRSIV